MKKKFLLCLLALLLILGIAGFLSYYHVDGTELPAIQELTGEYTASVVKTQNSFNNYQPQEYTLSSEQVLAFQRLLQSSSFTRHFSKHRRYEGFHDTYSIVLELYNDQGKQVDFIQIFFVEDLYFTISAPYSGERLSLNVRNDQLDEKLDTILMSCTPE